MVEKENRIYRICDDEIFKYLFIYENNILYKMIMDITGKKIDKGEIVPGYEVEPYILNGKTNRSDMLIKINKDYYINIEINYMHAKHVLSRNYLQLSRIFSQIVKEGASDKEISKKKIIQINFNTFTNTNKKEIEKGIYTDEITGIKLDYSCEIWNLDIALCYDMMYNKDVENLPKWVRWGALLYSDIRNIEEINKIFGGDLVDMKDKESFMGRIKGVNEKDRIVQEWMVRENNRLREEDIRDTAYDEGIEQGIEQGIETNQKNVILNMLKEKIDYSLISKITGKSTNEIKSIAKML